MVPKRDGFSTESAARPPILRCSRPVLRDTITSCLACLRTFHLARLSCLLIRMRTPHPRRFRKFIDELLAGPEPELESIDAAAALRALRVDAHA